MKTYTIKSFFELTSTRTGRNMVLNLQWLLQEMSMPGRRQADEQKCLKFATEHGWGSGLTIPITRWETLEAAFEVWPEAFEARALDGLDAEVETGLRARATLATLDHFLRDNFPAEYESFHDELGTSLMVQNILLLELRESSRRTEAFPMWERSWKQINRIAESLCSFNRVHEEELYDDKRMVVPENVAATVLLYDHPHHGLAPSRPSKVRRKRVDRTARERGKVVEKVFTDFVTAILGRKKFNGDMQECYDAMAAWDLSIHEPPWFGVEVWHIDDQGCLMVTEEAEEETEPEE